MKLTMIKKLFMLLLVGGIIAGCAPTSGPTDSRVDVDLFQQRLLALPGGVVDTKRLVVTYPGDVLFASGSVLPFPGGMDLLDPLINLFLEAEQISAELRIRSAGHSADYDQTLAEKRQELLQRQFLNRGVAAERLTWIVDNNPGAPVEIRFQLNRPATSSGKKS